MGISGLTSTPVPVMPIGCRWGWGRVLLSAHRNV